jgi:DNA-binding transcriptional MerR regulator
MFKIGEFSKISQVSMRMLRHYDEIGLFKPASVDRESGYRYYTADQLPRLNRILALKDLGLSLDQVAMLIDDHVEAAEIRGMLMLKRAQLQQQLEEELYRLARVETRLTQIEHEGKMPEFDAVLKRVESQRALSIRDIAPTFAEMGDMLCRAHDAIRRYNIRDVLPGVGIFYDPEFEEKQVDWQLGFPLTGPFQSDLDLGNGRKMTRTDIPGINMAASVIYRGSYLGLHRGYTALGQWIEQNGYRICGSAREIFLHFDPDHQDQQMTEILFPISKSESNRDFQSPSP